MNEAAEYYFRFHQETRGFTGCFLHDPAAVICATHPHLFETVEAPLTVTVDGNAMGRTREGGDGPRHFSCVGVDATSVRNQFLKALTSGRLP